MLNIDKESNLAFIIVCCAGSGSFGNAQAGVGPQ